MQFQWDDREPTAAGLLDPAAYVAIPRVGLEKLVPQADSGTR